MVVQARTLEYYRQLGFAREVIDDGIIVHDVHLRTCRRGQPARERVRLDLSNLGEGISPYAFALAYPQDDHQKLLVRRLAENGVQVEWNTKLERFTQSSDGVEATLVRVRLPVGVGRP